MGGNDSVAKLVRPSAADALQRDIGESRGLEQVGPARRVEQRPMSQPNIRKGPPAVQQTECCGREVRQRGHFIKDCYPAGS